MKQSGSQGSRFVIDSYGWLEYFSGGKLADEYSKYIEESAPENYFTPSIIVYEVYKKLRAAHGEEKAIKAIAHIQSRTTVVDLDIRLAIKGADASLEEELSMADALIRGAANHLGAKLVTSDPHFKGMQNVIFIG
jgi:predicted nucleic acid-binding protein